MAATISFLCSKFNYFVCLCEGEKGSYETDVWMLWEILKRLISHSIITKLGQKYRSLTEKTGVNIWDF